MVPPVGRVLWYPNNEAQPQTGALKKGGTVDRYELIRHLLGEEDAINHAYIMGEMDRDTWVKDIQSVDERLSVLGIRLLSRPESHKSF